MKQILRKTLLVLMAGIMSSAAWADEITVPTPVYKLTFDDASDLSDFGGVQHGSGSLVASGDARFGKYYQNWPDVTSGAAATATFNYLEVVPTTNPWESLRTSGTGAFTISFWCNASVAKDKNIDSYWGSLFTGYKDTGTSETRTWFYQVGPDLRFAGQYHHNNGGYSDDNADDYRDDIIPWREDKAWHHFAWVFSNVGDEASFNLSLYLDGTKKYEKAMTVNGDGAKAVYMLADLDRFVIGGASPIFAGDPDNAFAYDDIAFYTSALTQAQINKIINNKLVQGIQIGEIDYSTAYYSVFSDWVTLCPGQSFTYRFVNYTDRSENYKNWNLFVRDPSDVDKFILRADWWENINGSTPDEHRRGITSDAVNYWDNVPSKMNGATVEMTVTFTSDKKFTMTSTTTSQDESTTWTYNYTSENENSVDLTSYASLKFALSVDHSWLNLLTESVAIGATGWGTFASDYALDFSAVEGLKAYIVTGHTGTAINKSQVLSAPASTGLLLEGSAGTAYTIPIVASSSTDVTSNCLQVGTGATVDYDGLYDRYVLVNNGGSGTAVFKKILSNPATVATNRAYLQFSAGSLSRDILSIDGGDATGINMVNGEGLKINGSEVYYNLQGQRVLYPTKGLYIVNGKKVIIK